MPGRQAHGRPLLSGGQLGGKPRNSKRPRSNGRSKVLDAFAIATEQVPVSTKGVRTRDLDPETASKRGQNKRARQGEEDDVDDEDDDDGDDGDAEDKDGPRAKRARRSRQEGDDDGFEGFSGSDSERNDWHVGVNSGDEDSDIDSDEAFAESDEERYEGYTFRGSSTADKNNPRRVDDAEDGNGDDGESLGSDAIDLATALDQFSEDESAEGEQAESGLEEEEGSTEASEEDDSDDDEDDDAPAKVNMKDLLAGFGGGLDDDEDADKEDGPVTQQRPKLSLKDLGLFGVKDTLMRKSLKLMSKEEKAIKSGSAKKLEVPLARRQQDRLLRAAAYEKASKTLDRWTETVKLNRRADHLMFPLAQNAQDEGLNHQDFAPLVKNSNSTELEQAILNIMEESGLGPSAKRDKAADLLKDGDQQQVKASKVEATKLIHQRRRERELFSREQARAKRIKKIKSKVFRRIHRKEARRGEQAMADAMGEAGDMDSDEEREVMDRRRAEERMGTRHRQSKWAKLGKKAGRAVWDDDFRQGLAEMRDRNEELMRRVEGKKKGGEDSSEEDDDEDGDGDGDEHDDVLESTASGNEQSAKRHLRKQLERAAASGESGPSSRLANYKFMVNAETQRKKENDDELAQIHRVLDSEDDGEEEEEEIAIGRRKYGGVDEAAVVRQRLPNSGRVKKVTENKPSKNGAAAPTNEAALTWSGAFAPPTPGIASPAEDSAPGAPSGTSSRVDHSSHDADKKKAGKSGIRMLDVSSGAMLQLAPLNPAPKAARQKLQQQQVGSEGGERGEQNDGGGDGDGDGDEENALEVHVPTNRHDWEMIKRAFAGDDVFGDFEREKAAAEREDDDKEVDNTLPGWGTWVGEDVSERARRRHRGRFVTKVEGVKKKDRKDFKLKGVIISEKRVKKNDQFLASQLPYPFETKAQYERSLRLPLGPEWMTKETFQDSTKPRVIIKQGLIAPMSRPMH